MAEKQLSDLAFKLEELRQQQSCTDIVIQCAEGVVYAHRNVLVATCPYFEKMFTTDMSEKNTGCVAFKRAPKNLIEIIIKFLYTAQIPNLDNDCNLLRELIKTSHMMDLEDLYVNCWKQSSNNLSVENFADLWAVGIDFGLEKEGSIENYTKENMKEIAENANVQNLSQTQLTKLIECVDQKKFCDECVQCILKWKSIRDENEAVAANLLKKIDLQYLDDKTLHNLIQSNCSNEKKETLETVLTQEAVARLLQTEANKNIFKEIIQNCNTHGFGIYHAQSALENIKTLCEKLHM